MHVRSRAQRAKKSRARWLWLLLAAALIASQVPNAPSLTDLTTLALVQNLFVNLLPARSGSLAYVVLLNQKLEVQLAACFFSLAFSVILFFDLMDMLPLFLVPSSA